MTETFLIRYKCNACSREEMVEQGTDQRGVGHGTHRGYEKVDGWVRATFKIVGFGGASEGPDGVACLCNDCREKLGLNFFPGRTKMGRVR